MKDKPTALDKVIALMEDGESRTIRRISYLTGVSLHTVRKAVRDGVLTKIGEETQTATWARCGQAIVRRACRNERSARAA
jgi:hypothetical protein